MNISRSSMAGRKARSAAPPQLRQNRAGGGCDRLCTSSRRDLLFGAPLLAVLILACALCVGMAGAQDSDGTENETFNYGDLTYEILNETSKTVSVIGLVDSGTSSIEIPNTASKESVGDEAVNYTVVSIGVSAFDKTGLSSVTFYTTSLSSIGEMAFQSCKSLTEIQIPDTVTSIGSYAFHDCNNLQSVTIPSGITQIKEHTFSNCKSLTEIQIPDTVTSIDGWAFYACNGLQSIRFGKEIETITSGAFRHVFYDETGIKTFDVTTDVGELQGRLFKVDKTNPSKMIRQPLYTLTFDYGDGSVKEVMYNEGDRIAKPDDPERTGYSFMHWEKDGQEFDFANATMPAENITLTAVWKANQYTISFDSDGGSAVDPITQDYGTPVEKPTDPTREGYTFVCWMKDGKEYAFGTMPAENITLKAVWKTDAFTVTFDTGTGTEIAEKHGYGEAITLPGEGGEISRTGYSLSGWQISGEGDVFSPGTEYTVTSDITFTAVWVAVPSPAPTPPSDDDDDPYYPPSPSGDSKQAGKGSDSSEDILIIVACIAAFMAVLAAYICSAKR